MKCFLVFSSATDLEEKKGAFRWHTSVKLGALQFDSEFFDLGPKYYP